MQEIHVTTQLESSTITLPQLEPLVGKQVEIVVREMESAMRPFTQDEWIELFDAIGPVEFDENLVFDYREFNRAHGQPPPL